MADRKIKRKRLISLSIASSLNEWVQCTLDCTMYYMCFWSSKFSLQPKANSERKFISQQSCAGVHFCIVTTSPNFHLPRFSFPLFYSFFIPPIKLLLFAALSSSFSNETFWAVFQRILKENFLSFLHQTIKNGNDRRRIRGNFSRSMWASFVFITLQGHPAGANYKMNIHIKKNATQNLHAKLFFPWIVFIILQTKLQYKLPLSVCIVS